LDASALGEYLLRTEVGLQVETIIEAPESEVNIPAVCDLEICSALRRMVLARLVEVDHAVDLLGKYIRLPALRHGHVQLVGRVLELRDNFTAYDAAYVALCERLSATLVTCDRKLTRAAQRIPSLNVVGVAGA
jgi:predicted nucleic acid-binding protein